MVIFHSYVSLPEGKQTNSSQRTAPSKKAPLGSSTWLGPSDRCPNPTIEWNRPGTVADRHRRHRNFQGPMFCYGLCKGILPLKISHIEANVS